MLHFGKSLKNKSYICSMSAEKGNKYWKLRDQDGRNKLFETPEIFLNLALSYFVWADENPWKKKEAIKSGEKAGTTMDIPTQRPYTIEGLCIHLGITHQTFLNYENLESHKDFFEVFDFVRDIIENNQFEGATVGAYNATIIARKLGLTDKSETDLTTKGNPIQQKTVIEFVNAKKDK